MKFWNIFPILFLLFSGCSLRDRSEYRGVKIALPSSLKSNLTRIREPLNSAQFIPESINDLNCFALNVTGPGILMDSRFQCSSDPSQIGISMGFFPMQDTDLEIMVPVGADRKIQLIGVHSENGCPSFQTVFENKLFETEQFSSGYVLGEATIDVYDDAAVTLVAAFDPEKIFVPECVLPPPLPIEQDCGAGAYWNGAACVSGLLFECGPGKFIQSIDLQVGAIIDRLVLNCSPYSQGGSIGSTAETVIVGGSGGNLDHYNCPSNSLVSQVHFKQDTVPYYQLGTLTGVGFTCKDVLHSLIEPADESTYANFGGEVPVESFTCPYGQFAYGIETMDQNIGIYVDVITGIRCRAP